MLDGGGDDTIFHFSILVTDPAHFESLENWHPARGCILCGTDDDENHDMKNEEEEKDD